MQTAIRIANSTGQPITFADNVQKYTMLPGGVLEVTQNDGAVQQIEMGVTTLERPNVMSKLSSTLLGLPANLADLGVTAGDILTEMNGANRSRISMENNQLEASNVNYEKEMTDLINVQRSYQFNARTVTLADQMLGLINNIR